MIDDPQPPPDRADTGVDAWTIEEIYDLDTVALIDEGPLGHSSHGPPLGTGAAHAVSGARPIDPTSSADDPIADPVHLSSSSEGTDGWASSVRSGVAGLALAGMMTGVGEVLDPDRLQPEMVEFSPDTPDPSLLPVQFIHVPGDPRASRLIIRPWLFR